MKVSALFFVLTIGSATWAQSGTKFAKDTAIDNMAEVKLGQLAINRGISADVRRFGKMMVDDHTMAQNQLADIAARLKIKLPGQLDAKSRATYTKLSRLNGRKFDEAYKAEMVRSHAKDLQVLRSAARYNTIQALREYAMMHAPIIEGHLAKAKSMSVGMSTLKPTR